jgi:aryl-alcohol dehydrogenase-like predicted oxidoreductase
MKHRTLGHNGPQVSTIRYGAIVLLQAVSRHDEDTDLPRTLGRALEKVLNFPELAIQTVT